MGKRKRISDQTQNQSDHHPSPSEEAIQCSSNMELLSDENPSRSANPGALALPRILDLTDGSMKLVSTHPTMGHHHQSLGRSLFLKRSRHYYGHQYSQRNSANHAYASSSRGKGASSYDDSRLSFKLASQPNSQSKQHTGVPLMLLSCFTSQLFNFLLVSLIRKVRVLIPAFNLPEYFLFCLCFPYLLRYHFVTSSVSLLWEIGYYSILFSCA
ncbi:PREDICTED: uncharacterized protein LOC109345977 isoform X3 [Lupinus angustifolius]|uniref:uncharacterized protein LOC109345977 isoform X3 n=1 Tax=Lupinus angustifolius TaxID=3871 RepID=UPI00092F0B40|nr:PREDICTED: uncharacterized protein LOC109345977 isoform X3 [Lupinus angustifolius]